MVTPLMLTPYALMLTPCCSHPILLLDQGRGPDRDRARRHGSMVKVRAWQCPRSATAPPQGAPDSPGWLSAPRGEAGPLGAQPPPRVLELAASKAAHFTAFDHVGVAVAVGRYVKNKADMAGQRGPSG